MSTTDQRSIAMVVVGGVAGAAIGATVGWFAGGVLGAVIGGLVGAGVGAFAGLCMAGLAVVGDAVESCTTGGCGLLVLAPPAASPLDAAFKRRT